jgi:hypothetical protein
MPRALGGDHHHVYIPGRDYLLEMDVEAVGKAERHPAPEIRRDLFLVDLCLLLVVDKDHDNVGLLYGSSTLQTSKPSSRARSALLEPS